MSGYSTGRRDGQAEALTIVLPMKWWGPRFHRLWFWAMSQRLARSHAYGSLDQLRFVLAIRWTLLEPFERRKVLWHRRTPEQRWHLLFESNFDGDWDEYLDDFGAAANFALRSIVWVGLGYPGVTSMPMFKSFARLHDHLPEYYSSGYPSLTAADIRQELHARYGGAACGAIKREGYGRTTPQWTTFRLPIRAGMAGRAVRRARRLDPQNGASAFDDATEQEGKTGPVTDGSLFRDTGLVHFGRVVVLDRPTRSWLFVTITHDGPVGEVLHRLLADDAGGGLRRLVECCEGVPPDSSGWWSNNHLARHLLAHRPPESRRHLAYVACPGWTAAQVRDFETNPRRNDSWPVPGDAS